MSYKAADVQTVDDVGSVRPNELAPLWADDGAALKDRPNPAELAGVTVDVLVNPEPKDVGAAEELAATGAACAVPKDDAGANGVALNAWPNVGAATDVVVGAPNKLPSAETDVAAAVDVAPRRPLRVDVAPVVDAAEGTPEDRTSHHQTGILKCSGYKNVTNNWLIDTDPIHNYTPSN